MRREKHLIVLLLICIIASILCLILMYKHTITIKNNASNVVTELNKAEYIQDIDDKKEINMEKENTEEEDTENIQNHPKEGQKQIKSSELFSQYYDSAEEILQNMTLEEKVGQMFLARYPGTYVALNEIKVDNPGGYILFAKDFSGKTKETMLSELSNAQSNSKINLFLAVDEEGRNCNKSK